MELYCSYNGLTFEEYLDTSPKWVSSSIKPLSVGCTITRQAVAKHFDIHFFFSIFTLSSLVIT